MSNPKVISSFTVTIETTDYDSTTMADYKASQVAAINAALASCRRGSFDLERSAVGKLASYAYERGQRVTYSMVPIKDTSPLRFSVLCEMGPEEAGLMFAGRADTFEGAAAEVWTVLKDWAKQRAKDAEATAAKLA